MQACTVVNLAKLEVSLIRFLIPVAFINKLNWSVCTCLTQLYLMVEICIHKELHVSKLDSGHLQVEGMKKNLVSSYTRLMWVVYSGEVRGEVGTRSRMCYVGWAVWVQGVLLLYVMSR